MNEARPSCRVARRQQAVREVPPRNAWALRQVSDLDSWSSRCAVKLPYSIVVTRASLAGRPCGRLSVQARHGPESGQGRMTMRPIEAAYLSLHKALPMIVLMSKHALMAARWTERSRQRRARPINNGERRSASPPLPVWNGIFAAGDWRAKRGLKTMSPRRDRKSETTTREKWPQKRPFYQRAISCGFRKTGWWRMQSDANGSPRP